MLDILRPRAFRKKPLPLMLSLSAISALVLASAPTTAASAPLIDDPDPSDAVSSGGSRWSFKSSERCLMRKINKARRARGKRALDWDKQLGYVARRHAGSMAGTRGVWHDGSLGQKITRWRRLGQNTGRGGACRSIFRSFMRSSGHRANILGRWKHVGVGTVWAGGDMYVQQVFESRRDPGNIYSYP